MSIHDIGSGNDRSYKVSPNSDDAVLQRMAHNTNSTTYKSEGNDTVQRMAFKNGLILTYDGDNRVSSVWGYIPAISTEPVFIIAREGYDVFEDVLEIDPPVV